MSIKYIALRPQLVQVPYLSSAVAAVKMWKLYSYFLVGAFIGVALSATLRHGDDYVEYCDINGMKIREGEKASIPGKCKTIKCLRASPLRIATLGCSLFVLNPKCDVSEIDYTKSFPLCCPRSVCSPSTGA